MLAILVAGLVLAGSCAGAVAAAWLALAVLFHMISPRVAPSEPDVRVSQQGWSRPATAE
jgi:hypothetical protein